MSFFWVKKKTCWCYFYVCTGLRWCDIYALDTVYHGVLGFVTNCRALTHRCVLYASAGWPALSVHRLKHWYVLIYKSILGQLPSFHICKKQVGGYNLGSEELFLFSVPRLRTEIGKMYFKFCAPTAWNNLKSKLKLRKQVSLDDFIKMWDKMENKGFK